MSDNLKFDTGKLRQEDRMLEHVEHDAIHGVDTVLSALRTIVGGVESPLADAIYALQDAAIESTARAIGLEASADDVPMSPVRDIDGLLYIVERS